jgi:hypothetical protein
MKKLLLCALISLNINASIGVLDYYEVYKTVSALLPANSQTDPNQIIKTYVEQWCKEINADIILWSMKDPHISFPCAYYSAQADGTQQFIGWLTTKYRPEACTVGSRNR